ncbi:hypothetical protein [Lacibacter sp.]|jgi:hypothetical protein|uniref:hypothetical protein n=1 Tax=Lacibacter sp. TaxID=1915409 RepID=UPI002B4B0E70|nr:hypothetical protein [Lacibacter sp.]HLP35516.1 hypothetical protein [Lacibacter sp.]
MQFKTFLQSISASAPPPGSSVYLQSMWYDAKGDWHEAHSLVDHLHDLTACRVHAYLHRKEGDIANADYWYRRADKIRPSVSLQEEWEMIVKALL